MSELGLNQCSLETLEEELQLYKRLISNLPFEVDYFDEKTKKRIHKKKNEDYFTVTTDHAEDKLEPTISFPMDSYSFRNLEAFLQPLFDLVPHHIVFIDNKGIVTLCNKQTLEDFQTTRDAVLGKHIKQLLQIDEDQIKLLETLRTEKEIVCEEVLDKNYGICNTKIIRDQNGDLLRVVSLFHFLNPLKEAEKMKMIGQVSASIAHEIRNPLTTVRGYLQLLSQEQLPFAAELLNDLLIPELDRANRIISDFLMVSKSTPVKKNPERIYNFLTHFKNLMYSEAVMKEVEFSVNISNELTDTISLLNHNELLQVFINLFNNAVDSRVDGRPLSITLNCKKEDGNIVINFNDNGCGMSETVLRDIFDPFYSTKETGTGLGLSLSRKIIELHYGAITVSSTLNKGTSFVITLPITR
ncbi:PAS domain-containing protein [Anaerobacillus alkaliphilus]|uniref:histidine kinase n=1 Tax=Anaerobacillus alkaliphilus TaxID=1548597 RepID=A0A4Q0VVJ3_9BACI|nr:ATP-binding protein [Anaerobacillus alkaliphilus]RXJ02797.1 PAS domain-containing protein [Anaerobacillus alkaliphilus]